MALLFNAYLDNLMQDVLLSDEDKDILKAHASHATIKEFAEWIQHVGEHENE